MDASQNITSRILSVIVYGSKMKSKKQGNSVPTVGRDAWMRFNAAAFGEARWEKLLAKLGEPTDLVALVNPFVPPRWICRELDRLGARPFTGLGSADFLQGLPVYALPSGLSASASSPGVDTDENGVALAWPATLPATGQLPGEQLLDFTVLSSVLTNPTITPSKEYVSTMAASRGRLGYYLLDAASLCAPLLLSPRPGHRVLDLCAAPGGKSLVLAYLCFANEAVQMFAREVTERQRIQDRLLHPPSTAPVSTSTSTSSDEAAEKEGKKDSANEAEDGAKNADNNPDREGKDNDEEEEEEEGEEEEGEGWGTSSLRKHRSKLVLNDGSKQRADRLQQVVRDYLPFSISPHVNVVNVDATSTTVFGSINLDARGRKSLAANRKVAEASDAAAAAGADAGGGAGTSPSEGEFDRILVDAPCSSDRHLLHAPDQLAMWVEADTKEQAKRQQSLLVNAIRALKIGGRVVYSTCSLSPYENDGVVYNAIAHYGKVGKYKTKASTVLGSTASTSSSSSSSSTSSSTSDATTTAAPAPAPAVFRFGNAVVRTLPFVLAVGEPTSYGWIVLPDQPGSKWGPLYIACLERVG